MAMLRFASDAFNFSTLFWLAVLFQAEQGSASPQDLAGRFELPPGFHIYKAADPELSGGSYALTFDGEGRLLVGDGNAVRRLSDKDGDGVFDSYEVIATGLGWRGPQGLLVWDDRLYAVGGDGIQVFEGYRSGGPLIHRGRIGNKFNTGGDHDGHTIFRGHDGYLYFMAGNGAGIEDRRHITEETSPVLFEREASVFRISPDGQKWECVAAGGRNPPNLGMNYLGELFSFDSDMEWHVGLPWYRPVRLNQWIIGGDQGWQEVGAYPPYFIDCLPGILDVGRGSPTWGAFYEHSQFPEKYHDAFIVCDYRWKKESNDQYATTGRLVAFFLKREGARWKASMETLARPKPGARDAADRPINFALVDVAVAPDGSLFATDHNQGVWRIYHGETGVSPGSFAHTGETTALLSKDAKQLLDDLLTLPQPGSEWSRLREESVRAAIRGINADTLLQVAALDQKRTMRQRLRAIRLASSSFDKLPNDFIRRLAKDASDEIRGEAAWLIGIRVQQEEMPPLLKLLQDEEPFVRRRAAEALTRFHSPAAVPMLIERLGDSERPVRYAAMTALAHYPAANRHEFETRPKLNPQIRMRALVAGLIRRERPVDEAVRHVLKLLLEDKNLQGGTSPNPSMNNTSSRTADKTEKSDARWNSSIALKGNRLDLLRVLALFQKSLESDAELKPKIAEHLLRNFPDADREVRWEQIRLLGEYHFAQGFTRLLVALESERDEVTQFHIAQAIARISSGWTNEEEERLLSWILGTQRGWFAQFDGKGVEFPLFLQTALTDFGKHHEDALLHDLSKIDLASLLGSVALDLIANSPNPEDRLMALWRNVDKPEAKIKIIGALKNVHSKTVGAFLREEYQRSSEARMRGAILQSLTAQSIEPASLPLLVEGLRHEDPDVVRGCASAVIQYKPELDDPLANVLLSRLAERRSLFYTLDNALVVLSGQKHPGFKPEPAPGERLEESTRGAAIEFWKNWYVQKFGRKFEPVIVAVQLERRDEELHRFILGADLRAGNAERGAKVYEKVGCNNCHGGGVTPGREGRFFGPDLAGVTRRLTRQDLADAIVYPSKQVADRFKAFEVSLKDGISITGFITEQNNESVTLADREQVHRLARSAIHAISPQSTSLMPERLLNGLTDEEIRHLLTFLDEPGAAGHAK